jgi:lysozyme
MRRSFPLLPALLALSVGGCGSSGSDNVCSNATPLKTCPGMSVVKGVDVSTYQATITWAQVKAAGIGFAFARISDGATHVDSEFANNWKGMKTAGVIRGSYQYFRASQDPLAQVNLIVSSLNGVGGLQPGDLPVVMDIETADGQTIATLQAHMTTWLDAVTKATGRLPIIYTNGSTSALYGPGFGKYPLWVANWATTCPTMPAGWSAWKFWQYTDMGTVSGITGLVDLDEFDGTLADLASFAGGTADAGSVAANEAGSTDGSADAGARSADASSNEGASPTSASPIDSGSGQAFDAGAAAVAVVDAGATMSGGGLTDASRAAAPCRP